ncbi:hypothetical protein TNCV_4860421 [Trichonephila clavipes]|nr:hypothetical protein TNCV_4860421 [Trichonephila clavipes]
MESDIPVHQTTYNRSLYGFCDNMISIHTILLFVWDSPRQDKILCSMQTLSRSSTDAQSHFGMPNRRNKVTKNGNGPSEGLFAGAPVQP